MDVLPRTFRARFIDDGHVATSEETSPDQVKVENVPAKTEKQGTFGNLTTDFLSNFGQNRGIFYSNF